MTEVRISESEGTLRVGDGPNSAAISAGEDRWQASVRTGLAFRTSQVYFGGMLGLDMGARYKAEPIIAEPLSNTARDYTPRIDAKNLQKLGRVLHQQTNGTDDLNQLRVLDAFTIIGNYPALMPRAQFAQLQATLKDVSMTLGNIDTVRQHLHDNPDIGAHHYPALKSFLADPMSFNSLNQTTIGDLRRGIDKLETKASAENFVTEANEFLADLDRMMGADAPNKRLNKAQIASVHEAMGKLVPELKRLGAQLDGLPSVEAVRDAYAKVERINKFDPEISVRAQVAAAVAFEPVRFGQTPLTPVVGLSHSDGVGVGTRNLFAERRDDGQGKFGVAVHPSRITSQTMAVGVSSNGSPYHAQPGDMARAMGMRPSEEASSFGGYLAVTRARESMLGMTVTSTRAALVGNYHGRMYQDGFVFVEAGIDCPLKPANTPNDKGCEKVVRLGRRF